MNKEFVTYEQAFALKELGFDVPCIAWWFHEKLLMLDQYGDLALPEIQAENNNISMIRILI